MNRSLAARDLGEVIAGASVLVSAGSGGVGKTTTAAAIGLAAARGGRRVVVVTIDPARRLANALGLGSEGLVDEPRRIDGTWSGELWAAMLDTRATFDRLITEHADPEQAELILANRFYRNIAGSLSGTQEYMAAEKLHALHADPRFDLVVVDTPPTRNALDFIEAPHTLSRFLDHRLYRLLIAPTRRVNRALGLATSAFVRTVSRVAGAAVVEDAIEFFTAFDGLEEGFRARAEEVSALFRQPDTAFVLVTSPRQDALDEAVWFGEQLAARDMSVQGVIVNRVQPRPVTGPVEPYIKLRSDYPDTDLAAWCDAVLEQCSMADRERAQLDETLGAIASESTVLVPLLGTDVHDLSALGQIADWLSPSG